jgi:hypothetical protein
MDFLELDQRIMKLIDAGQFDIAEEELRQARLQASRETAPRLRECPVITGHAVPH